MIRAYEMDWSRGAEQADLQLSYADFFLIKDCDSLSKQNFKVH